MRLIVGFNKNWVFTKACDQTGLSSVEPVTVDLPHTWNGEDGQDGGNDYFRGLCCYTKVFRKDELPETDRYYIEINGANSVADVYLNGTKIGSHEGGYSGWRADMTQQLKETNELRIFVDNSIRKDVYPQTADFTFYGGLYRDVNIICVTETHFALEPFGTPGIHVTAEVEGCDANVLIDVETEGMASGDRIMYRVLDGSGHVVAESEEKKARIPDVRLWDGKKDPYLYTAEASIIRDGEEMDRVSARFGCRSFSIDPEKGFILNGRSYPLHGVCRHQDWDRIGNALGKEHHKRDMELICEMGANTIRLAHYQHDQYFYDLCDERGMIVWAEIPYISLHVSAANENAMQQMRELIIQCGNHPSICVWGLSNEITMKKPEGTDRLENHRALNELVHRMDPTRPTTMACFAGCGIDESITKVSDVLSYNLYFGWYSGNMHQYGPWFDRYHRKFPDRPIGCSEYGAEALNWHSANPVSGDYTEEYQAVYHEEVAKQLFSRSYIWATHVWNMFDFGADARAEGGENGRNHKGLVTIDRKYRKDAFYLYKAWLSDEPFVHICGKRYSDRAEEETEIKVYSNCDEVELFINGISVGKRRGNDHVFRFAVRIGGESRIRAVSGECEDECVIRKVEQENPDYRLKENWIVLNWNEITECEGRFSLNDKLSDLMKKTSGWIWFMRFFGLIIGKMAGRDPEGKTRDTGTIRFGWDMRLLSYIGIFAKLGIRFSKEDLLNLNERLNRIRK